MHKLVYIRSGDWALLFHNDILVAEDHSLDIEWLVPYVLTLTPNVTFKSFYLNDDWNSMEWEYKEYHTNYKDRVRRYTKDKTLPLFLSLLTDRDRDEYIREVGEA